MKAKKELSLTDFNPLMRQPRGYEEEVPDFVAFECYKPDEFDKKTGSPIALWVKYDSDMIIKR